VFDPPADESLRLGARSDLVRAWQTFLIQQGLLTGPADGAFGANTKLATMTFQATHGLAADGEAGELTLAEARELGFAGPPKKVAEKALEAASFAPAQKPETPSFKIQFVQLTRPDDSAVVVNVEEIVHFSPVPLSGPSMGPLPRGTRITFKNQSHLDVKELVDVMMAKIENSQH
jgi:peptidoglycan hydrolase-like protein with peptidoglycan-binding domain